MVIEFDKDLRKHQFALNVYEAEGRRIWAKYQEGKSLQTVFTPLSLVLEMLGKLEDLSGKDILVIANVEIFTFIKTLKKYKHIDYKSITFLTDNLSLKDKEGIKVVNFNNIDKIKLDMKFDVVIGNPPFNDQSTVQSTGRRRTGRMYLDFIYKSVELSKTHVLMISPARGWVVGTRRKKYLKEFTEIGLQSLHNCDSFFNIKIQDIIYLHIDKNNPVNRLIIDETETVFKPVKNNLGELYVRSMSEKRGVLESINDKEGSLVYLTTSKTTTIADTSLINDKHSNRWRVIFNVNGSKKSIGKVLVASPGTFVSYSVCYLLAKDEDDANRIKGILTSDLTEEIMEDIRVSASNTKYHFSFIENSI